MLSHRLQWHLETNAFSRAIARKRESGEPLIDLTTSNPTAVGFEPLPHLAGALARGATDLYRPDSRGSKRSRRALAEWLETHGAIDVDPEELFLTSSTSEAYGWILKLLCDPDDRVLRLAPTYPLLDHLCELEGVRLETLSLERSAARWELVTGPSLDAALARSKAVIVVHPNNPTGHYLDPSEVVELSSSVGRHGGAIIADEVFFEYGSGGRRRVASDAGCLAFSLGGLSKSAALPHWKLGWIRITGPEGMKRRAIEAMELVSDTYLPVSGPLQNALPDVLSATDEIRDPIMKRIGRNLGIIDAAISSFSSVRRDPFEGGWSAVLRVPAPDGEEQLILDLINAGVIAHPGYFYDFPSEGWLVLSLLTPEEEMECGVAAIRDLLLNGSGPR